jgi:pyruvate dehydrogenase E2 component (dihydrolipoamide acetyltransferase)
MVPGPTVPVSAMRGTIARRLAEAKATIPHFYVEIEIDANPLIELRQRLNAVLEKSSLKLSFNDFILKASAEALRRVPAVNASWEADSSGRPHIRHHGSAHVAFAVALEDGLVTPVIQRAEQKSLTAISAESKLLVERAKSKRLLPEEYTCGTFCVSNLGMHGIKRFQAIINPPQSAILALGAITETPMVRNGSVVAGQQLLITMSCDHRVVDGALAAKYLNALKSLLENPLLLLLEGRELEFAGTVCREE